MKKYTHEELSEIKRKGLTRKVCRCKPRMHNSMTFECPNCGGIFPEYYKRVS